VKSLSCSYLFINFFRFTWVCLRCILVGVAVVGCCFENGLCEINVVLVSVFLHVTYSNT